MAARSNCAELRAVAQEMRDAAGKAVSMPPVRDVVHGGTVPDVLSTEEEARNMWAEVGWWNRETDGSECVGTLVSRECGLSRRADSRGDGDGSRSHELCRVAGASGDVLRAVMDHLLAALRANDYKATDLARAVGSKTPFYLDEFSGLRLALILMAVKPLVRHDRIEAIGQGIQAMSAEEAYYWFSKCTAGPDAVHAQKALRVLLAGE